MASNKPPAKKQQHPPPLHPPDQLQQQDSRLGLAQELNSRGYHEQARPRSRQRGKPPSNLKQKETGGQSLGQGEMLVRSGGPPSGHDGESEINSPASSWRCSDVESGTSHEGSMHASGVLDASYHEEEPLIANGAEKYTRESRA